MAVTKGVHHVGLTVSNLEASAEFFTVLLGWQEVSRTDYPAIYVSDGVVMLTLWSAQVYPSREFDKDANIGLHHVALLVDTMPELDALYEKLSDSGVEFEFSPEFLRDGPARHMMCYEPSGIRVEFICLS